jgi:hypothetical protein
MLRVRLRSMTRMREYILRKRNDPCSCFPKIINLLPNTILGPLCSSSNLKRRVKGVEIYGRYELCVDWFQVGHAVTVTDSPIKVIAIKVWELYCVTLWIFWRISVMLTGWNRARNETVTNKQTPRSTVCLGSRSTSQELSNILWNQEIY